MADTPTQGEYDRGRRGPRHLARCLKWSFLLCLALRLSDTADRQSEKNQG